MPVLLLGEGLLLMQSVLHFAHALRLLLQVRPNRIDCRFLLREVQDIFVCDSNGRWFDPCLPGIVLRRLAILGLLFLGGRGFLVRSAASVQVLKDLLEDAAT
jgi:hypothetical protein